MSLGTPELDALLTAAMEAFNRLSPAEQAAHRFEQRVSWGAT